MPKRKREEPEEGLCWCSLRPWQKRRYTAKTFEPGDKVIFWPSQEDLELERFTRHHRAIVVSFKRAEDPFESIVEIKLREDGRVIKVYRRQIVLDYHKEN